MNITGKTFADFWSRFFKPKSTDNGNNLSNFVEVAICTDCERVAHRRSMHPAHPCPKCGARVEDGHAAQWDKSKKEFVNFRFDMRGGGRKFTQSNPPKFAKKQGATHEPTA